MTCTVQQKSPSFEGTGSITKHLTDSSLPSKARFKSVYGLLASGSSYSPRSSRGKRGQEPFLRSTGHRPEVGQAVPGKGSCPFFLPVTLPGGFRPRLQWRGRAGFSPASHFPSLKRRDTAVILNAPRLSTVPRGVKLILRGPRQVADFARIRRLCLLSPGEARSLATSASSPRGCHG
jgi:hypothetical protein